MKIHSNPAKTWRSCRTAVTSFANSEVPGLVSCRKVALVIRSLSNGLMERVFAKKSNERRERMSKVMDVMSFPCFKKFLRDSLRIAIKPKSVYDSMVLAREVWYLIHYAIGKRHKIEAAYINNVIMAIWISLFLIIKRISLFLLYYFKIANKIIKVSSWNWLDPKHSLRWEDKKKLVTKKFNKISYNLTVTFWLHLMNMTNR